MKNIATLVMAILIGMSAVAKENEAYNKAMTAALEQFEQSKSLEELTKTANQFKQISNVEKGEWLPLYYHAQCYILMGFSQKLEADEKDNYLDIAQESIDAMLEINDKESEILALQSLLHTARLVVDPMSRGQKMMGLSGKAIGQALALNPNNPRAQYLLLSNEIGQAQFFGTDISTYCDRIKFLNENWDSMNEAPKFYPVWGKGEAQAMMKNCE